MNQVSELEKQLANTKALINSGKSLARLRSNRDFKSLITDGFCLEESARSIKMASNSLLTESQRISAIEAAKAAGYLEQYLDLVEREARKASEDLIEIQETLEEARFEENS